MTDTIAPPRIQIGNDKIADRLFWETQRAIRARSAWQGRRVEPGAIDIERLVLAGSLTTNANLLCPHRQDWDHCPTCCH